MSKSVWKLKIACNRPTLCSTSGVFPVPVILPSAHQWSFIFFRDIFIKFILWCRTRMGEYVKCSSWERYQHTFFCVLINCKFKWTIQKTEKDRELNLAIFLFLPVATSPHPPRDDVYFPVWQKWARKAWEGRPNLSELNPTQPGQTCNWRQQSNWVVPPWNSKPWWLGNLAFIFFIYFFLKLKNAGASPQGGVAY